MRFARHLWSLTHNLPIEIFNRKSIIDQSAIVSRSPQAIRFIRVPFFCVIGFADENLCVHRVLCGDFFLTTEGTKCTKNITKKIFAFFESLR